MKRIDRMRTRLQELQHKQMDLYRHGKMIEGQKLFRQIAALQEEIKELDEYEPHKLSDMIDHETLNQYHIAEKIVAMHMASDFLADCSLDLRTALGKAGLADCFMPYRNGDVRPHQMPKTEKFTMNVQLQIKPRNERRPQQLI